MRVNLDGGVDVFSGRLFVSGERRHVQLSLLFRRLPNLQSGALIESAPVGKSQALWAMASKACMELGSGRQSTLGLAGGRKVTSERGAT